jgi:hypothetical protein
MLDTQPEITDNIDFINERIRVAKAHKETAIKYKMRYGATHQAVVVVEQGYDDLIRSLIYRRELLWAALI